MNELIERVAKVFADANLDGCETTDGGGDIKACVGNCRCRDAARTVIAAMREPTEPMILASAKADADQRYRKSDAWARCVDDEFKYDLLNGAKFGWMAAIDAALAEPPG